MSPSMSGEEIYRNFQEGAGPSRLAQSAMLVTEVAGRYQGRVDRILRLRARMEAAWQGDAAEAADRGLQPLVIEHELAARALHVAQDLTSRQVGSFTEAKNAVVPVPPLPEGVDALAMLADADLAPSYYQRMVQHNQAAQHNADVMEGYAGASQYNTDGQPTSYGRIDDDPAGVTIEGAAGGDGLSTEDESSTDDAAAPAGVGGGVVPEDRPEERSGAVPEGSAVQPGSTVPAGTVPATGVVGPEGADAGRAGVLGGGDGGADGRGGGGGAVVRGGAGGHGGGGVLMRGGGRGGGGGLPARGGDGSARGAGARSAVIAAGPGRGGMGFAGLPGPVARTRGDEDTERRAPGYLDGGDPEELWDTDELTAPPAIGDEDR